VAERRVGINVGTGAYIGARDAHEQGDGGDRQIQRFDFASLHLPTTFYSSPNRSGINVADAVDLSALTSTAITVGDKSVLIVGVDFNTAGANCVLVPVFYDGAGTPAIIGIGEEIALSAAQWRRTAAGNYFGNLKIVDVMGATSIRLAVKSISSGSINIYGEVI
jgi:hypothetical protein